MSRIYLIPTNSEIRGPIQNYIQNVDDLLGLQLCPFEDSMAQFIETDVRDHEEGMTAAHVLGTDPEIDERAGSKKFKYSPLHFKETDVMNEADILRARQLGTYGQPVDLMTEVTRIARNRAVKTLTRVEWTIWQMFGGRLQITEGKVKVDEKWDGVQEHEPVALWSNLEDATPLTDLDIAGDKFDGTGASMEGAIVAANRQTWRLVMQNQNDADLKALDRTQWGNFRFMFSALAKIIEDKCGAIIKSYDKGYMQGGQFHKFLTTGQVRIIGKRAGDEKVGKWWRTPSMHITKNGQEQPGYFVIVEANGKASTGSVAELGQSKNPKIEITGGVYGGPNLDFEDNVIGMEVTE